MAKRKSNHGKRRRVFADSQIQGGLCLRLVLYWVACQAVTLAAMFGLAGLNNEGFQAVAGLMVPAFVAGLLVLPLALFDLVIFSNKFAGPIRNFRRRFQRLADGEAVEPLQFRPGDFLCDLRDNYNKIQQKMNPDSPGSTAVKREEKELTTV